MAQTGIPDDIPHTSGPLLSRTPRWTQRWSGRVNVNTTPGGPVIPGPGPGVGIDANSANALAPDIPKQQRMYSALDEPLPVLFGGPERLTGRLYASAMSADGFFLYLCLLFCGGPVEIIGTVGTSDANTDETGIEIDNTTVDTANWNVHKYRGTQTQSADSWFNTLITTPLAWTNANGADMLGTAYMTTQFYGGGRFAQFPTVTAPVKGLLCYDPRSNLLLRSNEIAVSPWSQLNGADCTGAKQPGPYGATLYATLISDTNGSAAAGMRQSVTIPGSAASYVFSVKVKKTAGGTSKTVGIDYDLTGGTAVSQHIRLNCDTGAVGGTGSPTVTDLGSYWLVSATLTNAATYNTTASMDLYPATAAYGSFTDVAATQGSNAFCEAQLRLSTKPAGYITTTSAAIDQQTAWTRNTALCLGTYEASTTFGEGRTVDADSLADAAEYCDQVCGAATAAVYTWAANVVTVTSVAHGLPAGTTSIGVDFTSGAGTPNGTYTATYVGADSFTFPLTGSGTAGNLSWWRTSLAGVNEPRSTITLLIDQRQPVKTWRDLLRSYVPCWVNFDGDKAYLKVDKAGAVDHTFTAASLDATSGTPISLHRAGTMDTPNVVTVGWTDTSVTPWRVQTAVADGSGGGVKRKTRIDMPGIRSYSQARRFAIERLNHYTLEDLTAEVQVFEEGLKAFPGDICAVTDADLGLTSKQFRVIGVADRGNGRWQLSLREYQPNVYSNTVEATPTYPDLTFPEITVPTPTLTTAVQYQTDQVQSASFIISWNALSFAYLKEYVVEVASGTGSGPTLGFDNTDVKFRSSVSAIIPGTEELSPTSIITPMLVVTGVDHTASTYLVARLTAVSTLGNTSEPAYIHISYDPGTWGFSAPVIGLGGVTSGAPSVLTFLRGDNSWAVVPNTDRIVDSYGAVGNYVPSTGAGTDDADAIQDAIDACYAEGGGTVWLGPKRYKLGSAITIKPGVTLKGCVDPTSGMRNYSATDPVVPSATGGVSFRDMVSALWCCFSAGVGGGAIKTLLGLSDPYDAANRAACIYNGGNIENLHVFQYCYHNGMKDNGTDFETFDSTWNSTWNSGHFSSLAIRSDSENAQVSRCFIGGFMQAILSYNQARGNFHDLLIDCINGIEVASSVDTHNLFNIHQYPFTAEGSSQATGMRMGIGYYLHDTVDGARLNNCFTYGSLYGFLLYNCNGLTLSQCQADNNATDASGRYGLYADDNCIDLTVNGFWTAGREYGMYLKPGASNTISVTNPIFSACNTCAYVYNGNATFSGGMYRAASSGARVGVNNQGAGTVTLVGPTFDNCTTNLINANTSSTGRIDYFVGDTIFTPTWSSTGTQPTIGNGVIAGVWSRHGIYIDLTIYLRPGSTSTYGTGTYSITNLPFTSKNDGIGDVGTAWGFETGVTNHLGVAVVAGNASGLTILFDGPTANVWAPTVPWTFKQDDVIRISMRYKAAPTVF